jgi:ADP-ribose pyrophosphatase YjhB (NUDIX family)
MREIYSRALFFEIYDAIAAKLLENDRPIRIKNAKGGQDTRQLGIKWKPLEDPDEHSASCVILRELERQGVVGKGENLQFGKLLYSKYNELERDPALASVSIQGREYNEGLVSFLGHPSLEAFQKSLPARSADHPGYTYYIGTYYSFRSYRVNKFVLAIQYSDTPTQPMPCWEWGFHIHERNLRPESVAKLNSVRFEGKAQVSGRHLYINLSAPAEEAQAAMELHLIGICDEKGGRSLHQQEAIPCSLQTVSLDNYAISLEAYLLRCSQEEAEAVMHSPATYFNHHIQAESLKPEQEKILQLYLMLQRRNFRVEFRPDAFNLSNLEYRSNPLSRYTGRLSGVYRVWNFGLQRGVVLQSRLEIGPNVPYRAMFYPYLPEDIRANNPELKEHLAVLAISNEIRRDQLCFATFLPRRLTLVNYAIFDIQKLRDDNWAEGMFVTTGYDERGIIGGYAVIAKVKDGQDCDPRRMTQDEAEAYAQELGLEKMHNGLRALWKRKLWKQKSNTHFGCYGVLALPEKGILLVKKHSGPYAGLYDLPGGKLNHETPEEGLKRRFFEETGLKVEAPTLLANESTVQKWRRPDGIEESLHHVGALYRVALAGQADATALPTEATWISKEQAYNLLLLAQCTPFARKAIQDFIGG